MFSKNYFTSLFLVTLFLFAGITVFAQETKPITGKIELKKDGATTPVKGATISLVRIDNNEKMRQTTTNETGEFTFADVPVSGVFAIAVYAEGVKSDIIPDVKAGMGKFSLPVTEGTSERYSEQQIRLSILNSIKESGKLTAEQKKMLEDYENARGDIAKKNALVEQSLKEGNAAFKSGNMDLAVSKYDEGINASPNFVGSAPVLLNNKGKALKKRAVDSYNAAVKTKDNATIKSARTQVGKDLSDALGAFHRSYTILTTAPTADIVNKEVHTKNTYNAADGGRDTVRIMALIKVVDPEKADAAKTLLKSYLKTESDSKKKGQAQASLASYLLDAQDFDGAVAEYRKAVEFSPNDPDVLAGFSLALYTTAEDKQSKPMKQESLNYMVKYLKVAPKTHKLRQDIDGLANYLKTQEKLKPQKIK